MLPRLRGYDQEQSIALLKIELDFFEQLLNEAPALKQYRVRDAKAPMDEVVKNLKKEYTLNEKKLDPIAAEQLKVKFFRPLRSTIIEALKATEKELEKNEKRALSTEQQFQKYFLNHLNEPTEEFKKNLGDFRERYVSEFNDLVRRKFFRKSFPTFLKEKQHEISVYQKLADPVYFPPDAKEEYRRLQESVRASQQAFEEYEKNPLQTTVRKLIDSLDAVKILLAFALHTKIETVSSVQYRQLYLDFLMNSISPYLNTPTLSEHQLDSLEKEFQTLLENMTLVPKTEVSESAENQFFFPKQKRDEQEKLSRLVMQNHTATLHELCKKQTGSGPAALSVLSRRDRNRVDVMTSYLGDCASTYLVTVNKETGEYRSRRLNSHLHNPIYTPVNDEKADKVCLLAETEFAQEKLNDDEEAFIVLAGVGIDEFTYRTHPHDSLVRIEPIASPELSSWLNDWRNADRKKESWAKLDLNARQICERDIGAFIAYGMKSKKYLNEINAGIVNRAVEFGSTENCTVLSHRIESVVVKQDFYDAPHGSNKTAEVLAKNGEINFKNEVGAFLNAFNNGMLLIKNYDVKTQAVETYELSAKEWLAKLPASNNVETITTFMREAKQAYLGRRQMRQSARAAQRQGKFSLSSTPASINPNSTLPSSNPPKQGRT